MVVATCDLIEWTGHFQYHQQMAAFLELLIAIVKQKKFRRTTKNGKLSCFTPSYTYFSIGSSIEKSKPRLLESNGFRSPGTCAGMYSSNQYTINVVPLTK